jgi:hypothetical protein
MQLKTLLLSSCISAALAFAASATAATVPQECVAAEPTAASQTWDFKGEANNIFKDIQSDAQQAATDADYLQSLDRDPMMSWESHAEHLESLKAEINDIGAKLCRLQTIRRMLAPWQQSAVDQIVGEAQLMANNTQDAIAFGGAHRSELWLGAYRGDVTNLANEANALNRVVRNVVEFPGVSKEYRELRHDFGTQSGS